MVNNVGTVRDIPDHQWGMMGWFPGDSHRDNRGSLLPAMYDRLYNRCS